MTSLQYFILGITCQIILIFVCKQTYKDLNDDDGNDEMF